LANIEPVDRFLDQNGARFVDELKEFLRIPSVSANPAHKPDMERAAEFVRSQLEQAGAKAQIFKTAGHPIVYTIPQDPRSRPTETLQRFEEKMPNWNDYRGERDGYAFANEIAPQADDIIIVKPTASSFYRTDLEEQLRELDLDCLVVTGGATSGCVRATVVDAHARGFKVNVAEDAVFDRGQVTHAMNLFDMQALDSGVNMVVDERVIKG